MSFNILNPDLISYQYKFSTYFHRIQKRSLLQVKKVLQDTEDLT